jgi:hypothetical protein
MEKMKGHKSNQNYKSGMCNLQTHPENDNLMKIMIYWSLGFCLEKPNLNVIINNLISYKVPSLFWPQNRVNREPSSETYSKGHTL